MYFHFRPDPGLINGHPADRVRGELRHQRGGVQEVVFEAYPQEGQQSRIGQARQTDHGQGYDQSVRLPRAGCQCCSVNMQ